MIHVRLREVMKLYEERTGQRMTYEILSDKAGLSTSTLQSLGSREGYNATLKTIDKICEVLGCGLDELLERQDGAT